jgi:flagellar biosynthetic protein FliR
MTLADFSIDFIFSIFLVFCRIGSAIMFVPGIGETFVSPRIRLTFAALLSFVVMPVVHSSMPTMPSSVIDLTLLIGAEVTIGIALGMMLKIILSSIHVLGMIIAYQSGLASGMIFDPSQGNQGTFFGNFLTLLIVVVILASDTHYILIKGLTESFKLINFGTFAQHHDSITQMIIRTTSDAFNVGVKLAAPFIISGLILYLVSGVLSRLMPQLQIFFLMLPAQILMGFTILLASLSGIVLWFISHYEETIINTIT